MHAHLVHVETHRLVASKEIHFEAKTGAPESIIHSLHRSWATYLYVRSQCGSRPRCRKPLGAGPYWQRSDDALLRQFEAYLGKYILQPSQIPLETRRAVYPSTIE